MRHENYEPHLRRILPPAGDIAVDVGANHGQYVELLVPRFRQVIAYEPQQACIKSLAASFWGEKRLELRPFACGAARASVQLLTPKDPAGSGGATLLPAHPHGHYLPQRELVEVVRLDDHPFDGRVDFLKVDVEGTDLEVLQGAELLIRRDRPSILIEEHVAGDAERGIKILQAWVPGGYNCEIVKHEIPWRENAVQRWLLAFRLGEGTGG